MCWLKWTCWEGNTREESPFVKLSRSRGNCLICLTLCIDKQWAQHWTNSTECSRRHILSQISLPLVWQKTIERIFFRNSGTHHPQGKEKLCVSLNPRALPQDVKGKYPEQQCSSGIPASARIIFWFSVTREQYVRDRFLPKRRKMKQRLGTAAFLFLSYYSTFN